MTLFLYLNTLHLHPKTLLSPQGRSWEHVPATSLSGGIVSPWSMVTGLWPSLSPGSRVGHAWGQGPETGISAGETQEQLLYETNSFTSLSWVCDQFWKVQG